MSAARPRISFEGEKLRCATETAVEKMEASLCVHPVAAGKEMSKPTHPADDPIPVKEEELETEEEEEEDEEEDDDAGSLVDFIVEDEEGEEEDDDSSVVSDAPKTKGEAISKDMDGIDVSNILSGKRNRKQTETYEQEVFSSKEYKRMLLCDVPKEEMQYVHDCSEEEEEEGEEDSLYGESDEEESEGSGEESEGEEVAE